MRPITMTFIPFRTKILGAFLALLGAVLAASLVIVDRSQTRQVEAGIRHSLEGARGTFGLLLQRYERQLTAALSLTAENYAFKKAIAVTRDPATIESAALSVQNQMGVDAVWVTDEEGILYADTSERTAPGTSIAELDIVGAALVDEPGSAIHLIDGVFYQLAAVPIYAPDLIGVLVAGFRIEDAVLPELKRLTLSDVSYAANGRLFASTLPEAERAVLESALSSLPPGEVKIIGPRGRRQLVLATQPSSDVTVCIQRSWDEALEPLRSQERLLLLVGLAGFGLTAAVGFVVADGVTASVRRLAAATRRLAEGDYAVRVALRTRDEIGQLGAAFNQMVEGLQEREKIRSVLRKAVSREIADELLRRGKIELGGEERRVTVLFSDIREFTTLAEAMTPHELVTQLNDYFQCMTREIESRGGVIDKYVGDAIMALFGAPLASEQDAASAQRAALGMVRALDELNALRAEQGLRPWMNGIGIHTGQAVAGTMGSEDRWSYTVIGDSVNLAARLEGLTKHYGARVLVSKATREDGAGPRPGGGGEFLYRTLDLVRVKGRNEPVEVFELLAETPEAPAWLGAYEESVRAYRRREFRAARDGFREVVRLKGEDEASMRYLERVAALLDYCPPDWDAAHTMEEK